MDCPLGFDELLKISEALAFDNAFNTLTCCALTCKLFHRAASKILYSKVVFAPPFTRTLRLGARDEIPVRSSRIAHLVPRLIMRHVRKDLIWYPQSCFITARTCSSFRSAAICLSARCRRIDKVIACSTPFRLLEDSPACLSCL